jgi:anti-sigma regulatory factor (Ser/Thr protein kinase)
VTKVLRAACSHATDHVVAAHLARKFAREIGFDEQGANAVAISTAELVSNAVRHAKAGTLELRELSSPRAGVEIVVRDEGPGITSPELAVVDGWSRGQLLLPDARPTKGLGRGLGAVYRLSDSFEIKSAPRETVVIARRFVDSNRW